MESMQNFRSALNGFNRSDVVHYLEYLNARHEKQCAQLQEQLNSLQQELEQAGNVPSAAAANQQVLDLTQMCAAQDADNADLRSQLNTQLQENASLHAEAAGLNAQLDALRQDNNALRTECTSLHTQLNQLAAQREQDLAARQDLVSRQDQRKEEELEAYRRAERTERLAKLRASQIYDQANAALAGASAELEDAMVSLQQVTEDTVSQIQTMQQAVLASQAAFTAAEAALRCIKPSEEV